VTSENSDDRVRRLGNANYDLRMALRQCREQLDRIEELLLLSKQDNQPNK
jgi:hypothetical protein